MLRQLIPRYVLWTFACVTVGAWAGYTISLSHRVGALQVQAADMRGQVANLSALVRTANKVEDDRLSVLEADIFGPKAAPPATPDAAAAWQRNRDRELRRRIDALEAWRLRVEKGGGQQR